MDLRQLRYFCAIAARRSFRQASDDVLIAQPALSQQIRRLEVELGVKLFDRASRPVELTDAGQTLLRHANQILADVDRAVAEVREFGSEFRGKVVVATMQYLTSLELPDLLTEFHAQHPAVELKLLVGNSGEVINHVEDGAADLALCHIDDLDLPPEFSVEELRTEELVVIVEPSDPIAGMREVSVKELASKSFVTFRPGASIRTVVERAFDDEGVELRISFESGDIPTTLALVSRGLGVAVVPRSASELLRDDQVAAVPIGPIPLVRRVGMVSRRDRHRSQAVDAFEHSARRIFAR